MADLLRKYKSLYSSTANSFGTGTGETITPASVVGLPTDTEIVLTFDRVDSSGTATPSKMERIVGTISGGNLAIRTSPSSGRGFDGSTEQAHTSPVVEMVWNATDWNDAVDAFLVEHTQAGAHSSSIAKTSASQTFTGSNTFSGALVAGSQVLSATRPKVTTSIDDANGNEVIKTPATASAVNELTVTNAAASDPVQLSATGEDTNIELKLASKGSKQINISKGMYQAWQSYSPSASGTATLDLSAGNKHLINMPAGNITVALSNEQVGQIFQVKILQDGGGSRTVTWFTTIKWAGGSAPTLTTTANKADSLGFEVTSSGNYDGFVIGQNI